MDLHRWTCNCGVWSVAEAEDRAVEAAEAHAYDMHGVAAEHVVKFDVFTEKQQEKLRQAHLEAEAAELGLTAAKLAKARTATEKARAKARAAEETA